MSILANGKKHFSRLREDIRVIEVPEWGDDSGPAKIYFKPIMNMYEKSVLFNSYNQDRIAYLVDEIIERSLDVDGKKLFHEADKTDLMYGVSESVVTRIAAEMGSLRSADEEVEEMEKNSEPIQD